MNYIDLFAGGGGLSEGFFQAGFEPVAHIEMNSNAAQTLKTRTCYYYLRANNNLNNYYQYQRGNISRAELYDAVPQAVFDSVINAEITEKNIKELFEQVDGLLVRNPAWNNAVDVIVGGPPCQAYSLVGRSCSEDNMLNDPRNFLYKLYCRFLKQYHPKMFVFENVPGLLTANGGVHFKNLQRYLKHVGYEIEVRELNSKDYGVLQSRRRIIIIGWRIGANNYYPDIPVVNHDYLVDDVLNDLPSLQSGQQNNTYSGPASQYLIAHGLRDANDVLTQHVARPNIDRDRQIYRKVIEAWNDGHRRIKYTDLPAELRTHKNITSFLDRFKVVEGGTPTCHTMMAHISKDGHYFIHPDINQARSITVREAARIQSFPDNYYFEGGRTAAFTQIGNAVPPLMARAIAQALRVQL